jgi:transcriptional regulator with XRE-family HTH domain
MDQNRDDVKRLDDVMNLERARQGKTWDDIARESGISVAQLRNIRKGRASITLDSKIKIEQAYGWPEGFVDNVLRDRATTPPPDRRYPPEVFQKTIRDSTEADMLKIRNVAEEVRWSFVFDRRKRLHDEVKTIGGKRRRG